MKTNLFFKSLKSFTLQLAPCTLYLFTALCSMPPALSQIPQGFNYQAIARDGSGNPITDPINVEISILSDDDPETSIRVELFSGVDPNEQGLFSIVIGTGTYQSGEANFSDIDWSVTPKYIKTRIYYLGEWKNLGATQLWSVPYAMVSTTSDTWTSSGSDIYRANGNVGIGTTTPIFKFQVQGGESLFGYNSGNGSLRFTTGFGNSFMFKPLDHALQLQTDHTGLPTILYMDKAGPVGIGTDTPQGRLHVAGNTISEGLLAGQYYTGFGTALLVGNDSKLEDMNIANTMGIYGLQDATQGHIKLGSDGPIISGVGGNVGIGITTPGFKLDVGGRTRLWAGGGSAGAWLNNLSNTVVRGFMGMGDNDDYMGFWGHGGAGWGLTMNVINGNVGIGTATPNEKLDVEGNIKSNYLYIDPQDGLNEGGEMLLIGAGSNPSIAIDNWGGHVRMHTFSPGKYLHLVNGSIRADGTSVSNYFAGNVGIGNASPASKLSVQVPTDAWADEVPLFEVKNKKGVPVLAVYNYGVRILVDQSDTKAVKGGFAVSGYDYTKAGGTIPLMIVNPDSIRFNINNKTSKGYKGGFAVGSYGDSKGPIDEDFMHITPQGSDVGEYNTFIGYKSGLNTKKGSTVHEGTHNTFIGYQSGITNTLGAYNVFVGDNAGYQNLTGVANVYLGQSAGYGTGGNDNVAIGTTSFYSNTTGEDNVAIGDQSGYTNSTGSGNVFLGSNSGYYNTAGANNTYLGSYAGRSSTGSNNVFIGHNAGRFESGSGFLYIDNSTTSSPLIWGNFSTGYEKVVINGNGDSGGVLASGFKFFVNGTAGGTTGWTIVSDSRYKKDIVTIGNAIQKVMGLRGVNFNWIDSSISESTQMGFIAQETIDIIPEVVHNSNGYYSMEYAPITALLVEGMKEQQGIIQNQQQQINAQTDKIEKLEKMIVDLQRTIASASQVPKP